MYFEWFVGDNLEACRPLTCSISQSDLQSRERDEPAELEGVRISVRERRTRVGLALQEKWGKSENVTFHTKRTRCGNVTQTYHFFLQLVVFPADQYHCFLEHWWESAREHMSVLDLTVHASWGKPTEGAQPQKHFKCQLEALKHISALQLWILKFCSCTLFCAANPIQLVYIDSLSLLQTSTSDN